MEYNVATYKRWLDDNVTLSNAYSNGALRELTEHILMGKNYRLLTEKNTKEKLLLTYLWIMDVVQSAKTQFGQGAWQESLLKDLQQTRSKTTEQKNLIFWLLGITAKTSTNLGLSSAEYPEVLRNLAADIQLLFTRIDREDSADLAWLLMIGGAATLNIRGSDKSKVGKQLEKVVIKSLLTILGFTEGENFWINIGRDNEVEREADAEVETKRGRVRIEVGLIAAGNQEVIEDKIGRMARNDIVLYDVVGPRSRIHETAKNANVNLVQIRNGEPLFQIHRLLNGLTKFPLKTPPRNAVEINQAVFALPDTIFDIAHLEDIL
ncbi:CfrBI family restriction endonuclease [Dyadobacter crusticola]|uniref:CfrBI family restriction endonuclease n=1 Tax=Dyadobacter crusticola TaxID=292407 RepID=UPI0004E16FBA|nr:CfrBI family restriction endonuclease [Dyadobacter crusticola]